MVMRKNVLAKNLSQSILNSITRYIAIMLIIALGAALYVGLVATKGDMIQTGQEYMDDQNMFDLRLLNSYGWTDENVAEIAAIDGVVDAEGMVYTDVLARLEGLTNEAVFKVYTLPERINLPYLIGGRMPESPNECLVDGAQFGEESLGKKFVLSGRNEDDTLESFTEYTFTIVGYVSSPLYFDMSRGTTTLGNGTVTAYMYVMPEAMDVDYYSEICITMPGDYAVYTEEYHDAMDDMAEYIKPLLEPIAYARYESVMAEAEESYQEGYEEYLDGLQEYQDARKDAMEQLEEARQELIDGQAEIDENLALLEDALVQIADGQKTINENAMVIIQGREELANAKSDAYAQISSANTHLLENRKLVTSNLRTVEDGLAQLDSGLAMINDGISQLESGLEQMSMMEMLLDTMLGVLDIGVDTASTTLEQAKASGLVDPETIAEMEQRLAELETQRDDYQQQYDELLENQVTYSAQLEELYVQRDELNAQREEVVAAKRELDDALTAIDNGVLELQSNQAMMENEFAAAEAQLESGQMELDMAQIELNEKKQEVQDGLAELEKAQQQIYDGWEEYRKGRDEALQELSEAELKLLEGQVELTEARETIDGFKEPDLYALGRNSNVSYLSLDSNSDIVEGVSAVFPVFFLLIAALVCITTMNRMVEEERTQIGTMKALGYSNAAIIGKYLAYAGSAAVLGCGVGVLVGSQIFPLIIWEAYNIILNIRPNITLLINVPLCTTVVVTYTLVTLAVTGYCCRSLLREVPAELIRPKAPTSGKKIFLEYLPFWKNFSFLNKVMLRNIFRYRQRLLMMLVGIGGCTALLLTGFGIRDSIVDIVNYQYQEVTLYDMEVRFSEGMDEKDREGFESEIGRYVDGIVYAHQSSVELDFGGQTRDILMISVGPEFENYVDFHSGKTPLSMPGPGEALLTVGMAEKLGVKAGDTVTVRDPDLNALTLTISAVYDNNVYNYIIIAPETIEAQWGEGPEMQMAYITVNESQDVHYASTKITGYDGVMSVSVSVDLAEQVNSMLGALDLVVITVVICAGLLSITVLYNLTNINITERIREIATIKVLGFNAMESAAYVFKENMLLSVMGAFVGLFFGRWLLEFVMSQIKVDMVWMQARLLPMSYVWAIGLTLLSAVIVDFVLYFKLEKINMAEALKSVE